MIIGISGKIGSGKDTVGNIIQYLTAHGSLTEDKSTDQINKYLKVRKERPEIWEDTSLHASAQFGTNWEIKKFAGKLKQIAALLTGCTVEDLESQEFKQKTLGANWNKIMTPKSITVKRKTKFFDLLRANSNWYYTGEEPFKIGSSEGLQYVYNYYLKEESFTYRWLLQTIGTEAMRDKIHENVWVNALFADYKSTGRCKEKCERSIDTPGHECISSNYCLNPEYPNWLITDMRFPNELRAVKEREGITIRVNRQVDKDLADAGILSEHPSEIALDGAAFDYIIENNGTIEDLIQEVKKILILEKIL